MSMEEGLKIGAAYIRASTDDQLEYSPDSQIKKTREFASREGCYIPDEYIFQDDAISGKKADKRPEFLRLIGMAKEKNPPFERIYVWEFSRFARNREESVVYKNLLRKNGVLVKSVREPLPDGPFAGLIEAIIEWMDEYYLINLAHEVRRGMGEKASRGEATGRPPFGFDVKNKVLVPNDNADVVRYIFEMYAAGHSLRDVAASLNDKAIKTTHGKSWDTYSVRYVLQNPAYIGKLRWTEEDHAVYRSTEYMPDKQELPNGQHEAIIGKELWGSVQNKLAVSSQEVKYVRHKDGKPNVYMLKGLIRCSCCGATLTRISRGGHKNAALQCYRYSRGQCKVSHCVSEPKAEQAVIAAMEHDAAQKSFEILPKEPSRPVMTRDWDKLIAAEQKRQERAKQALLEGAFTPEEYKQVKSSVQANIDHLKAAQDKERQSQPPEQDQDFFAGRVCDVVSLLKSDDVDSETKSKALRSIVEKIVYNKNENSFYIYYNFS